jgi:hypothetical protein
LEVLSVLGQVFAKKTPIFHPTPIRTQLTEGEKSDESDGEFSLVFTHLVYFTWCSAGALSEIGTPSK